MTKSKYFMMGLQFIMGFAMWADYAAGALPASDNASDSAYGSGWANGSNGGNGYFGNWQLSSGSNSGFFIGDSTGNAGGHAGGINTSGAKAWGIYANSGDLATAVRPFAGAMLSNETFYISMNNGWINSGGPTVGFGLQDVNGTNRFQFYFAGGDSQYRILDNGGGAVATGIGWTAAGLNISFTLTDSNKYSLSVVVVGSTTTNTFTGTLAGFSNSGITQAYLWNYNAGSGSQYDAFFNSMSLVCGTAAPAISAQPSDQTVCVGDSATIFITATGTDINYLWRKGGSGWGGLGGWILTATTNDLDQAGQFIGSSGVIDSPNGVSWGLYANSEQSANAVRLFNGAMPVGQVFMIDMANSLIQSNGTVGFGLQDANGTNRFEFFFAGGQTNYFINDGGNVSRGGAMITLAGFVVDGLHLEFMLTDTNSYSFRVVYQNGYTVNTNGTLEGVSGSGISQVRLFNVNAGATTDYDLFFNNMLVDGKADNAGDGVYNDGWQTGDGGGWQLATSGSGSGGFFVSSSTGNGGGDSNNDGDINSYSGVAWGMYANSGKMAEATRLFNTPLQVGQTFKIDMDNGYINSAGPSVGLSLRDSSNTNRFEFFFRGGQSHYEINDASGTRDSGIGFTDQGLHLTFTLTATNTYSLNVVAVNTNSPTGGPWTISGTMGGVTGKLIDRLRLFNYNAGSGTNYDAYFNNIIVGSKSDNASDPVYGGGWTTGNDGGLSLTITSSSFTVSNVAPTDAGNYDVLINDTCGRSITSGVSALIVPLADAISGPPALNALCTGVYRGPWGANLAYNWSVSSNAAIMSGSTSERYIMVQALDTNSFTVALTLTNGLCVDTAVETVTVQNAAGLKAEYYKDRFFTDLAFIRLDSEIDFDWSGISPDLTLIPQYHYSVRWTGQFHAQYSEPYTFTTVSDDGVRLWIDGQLIIDNWTTHTVVTNTATINLSTGHVYNVRLDYFQEYGDARIALWWLSAHQSQQVIPFSNPVVQNRIPGVSDAVASALGLTGPNVAALSDTVSMAEQVFQTFNNPLTNDLDGTVSDIVVMNGSQTNNALGQWQVDGDEIYAIDRRGYVEYQVTIPSTNVFRLVVTGRESVSGHTQASLFDLQAHLDGEYLGREILTATPTSYGEVHYYTPLLLAGMHTVRIFWDNAHSITSLRIRDLRIQSLGGADSNMNGIKDWVETRLATMCGVDPQPPTNSYISPVCLEGRGSWLSMMTISAGGTNLSIGPAPGQRLYQADIGTPPCTLDRWYGDVPLLTNTSTQIIVSHQNGGLVETNTVAWVPKDVLQGGSLAIRKGDSLLLTALNSTNAGNITIIVGTNSFTSTTDAPVRYQFNSTGTNVVTGVYSSGGIQLTGNVSVIVVGHEFSSQPDAWVTKTRDWDNFSVSPGVVFQGDPRLLRLVQTSTLTNAGQRSSLLIDKSKPCTIVSRTATNGAILAHAAASGFRLYGAYETYNYIIETYSDGSRLGETLLVESPVVSGATIQVQIIVGGVTFDDGTTYKELTAGEFDALGQYKLRFIMPAGAQTANCHTIEAVQDGSSVGSY